VLGASLRARLEALENRERQHHLGLSPETYAISIAKGPITKVTSRSLAKNLE
jgi:hypothetical protein